MSPTMTEPRKGLRHDPWPHNISVCPACKADRATPDPAAGLREDIVQAATGGPDFTVKRWPPTLREAAEAVAACSHGNLRGEQYERRRMAFGDLRAALLADPVPLDAERLTEAVHASRCIDPAKHPEWHPQGSPDDLAKAEWIIEMLHAAARLREDAGDVQHYTVVTDAEGRNSEDGEQTG